MVEVPVGDGRTRVPRCNDPDCPFYGEEMVNKGYDHPVCPSVPGVGDLIRSPYIKNGEKIGSVRSVRSGWCSVEFPGINGFVELPVENVSIVRDRPSFDDMRRLIKINADEVMRLVRRWDELSSDHQSVNGAVLVTCDGKAILYATTHPKKVD